jgi:uncharacterized protein (TIGR03000 family)
MSGGAWHGGGGSFHTGNMGGFHGGGSNNWHGGGSNNWHGGGFNNWHGGYNNFHGYGYGWGYPGFGLYIGLGGGYGGGFGGGYGYDSGYSGYTSAYANPDYSAGAQTQPVYTPDVSTTARLDIRVPADAQVWVEGVEMKQTGAFRQMISPPVLEPGKTYHYTVKATWNANGQPVTESRKINVQAGLASLVDFTKPEGPNSNMLPNPAPNAAPNPARPPANPLPTTPPVNPTRVG